MADSEGVRAAEDAHQEIALLEAAREAVIQAAREFSKPVVCDSGPEQMHDRVSRLDAAVDALDLEMSKIGRKKSRKLRRMQQ